MPAAAKSNKKGRGRVLRDLGFGKNRNYRATGALREGKFEPPALFIKLSMKCASFLFCNFD
jgi:hypothetical protein